MRPLHPANVATAGGNPDVVRKVGATEARKVQFLGVESYHDSSSGSERGANVIFRFSLDGIRVCHLGDLGHNLDPEDQAQIGPVDILLVPVGGNFTIDAGIAADLCRKIAPSVAIPMHYRNEKCQDFPVAGVEDFLQLMKNVIRNDVSETMLEKDSLPEATQVIVLKPAL